MYDRLEVPFLFQQFSKLFEWNQLKSERNVIKLE